MKNILTLIVLLVTTFFTTTSYAAEKTCSNGDVTGLTAAGGDYCFTEPTYYGITVYEMVLCTAAPTAPTTSSTVVGTGCEVVFSSSSGALVEVQDGVTSSLAGTINRPPNGTYTHAYMRINNTFLIKGSVDFGATVTATTDNETGAAGTCSATAGATPGLVSTELTDFSGGDHSGTTSYTVGSLTAYILDANQHLATVAETNQAGASSLLGMQAFATPIVFNDNTTSMNAALRVTQGMTVSVLGANSVGFDSGPFFVTLTVN